MTRFAKASPVTILLLSLVIGYLVVSEISWFSRLGEAMGIVLALSVAAQVWNLQRAVREALGNGDDELAERERAIGLDLIAAAECGHPPAWREYRETLDSVYEERDDKLRTFASSALALGLAATILALVVSIPRLADEAQVRPKAGAAAPTQADGVAEPSPADPEETASGSGPRESAYDPRELIQSTIGSLSSSLLGALFHLTIALHLLPSAERRFQLQAEGVEVRLRALSERNKPRPLVTATLEAQLASLQQALVQEVGQALLGLPAVLKELAARVEGLAASVTDLEVSKDSVAESLRQCAGEVQQVAGAARAHEAQMLAHLQELRGGVDDVRAAVDQIPGGLAAAIEKASTTLGREFGREAAGHWLDVAGQIKAAYRELGERVDRHEESWRRELGERVGALLDGVASRIEERVVERLEQLSAELGRAGSSLAGEVAGLEAVHQELSGTHGDAVRAWREAGEVAGQAAENLKQAQRELASGTDALRQAWTVQQPALALLHGWAQAAEIRGRRFEALAGAVSSILARRLAASSQPPVAPERLS